MIISVHNSPMDNENNECDRYEGYKDVLNENPLEFKHREYTIFEEVIGYVPARMYVIEEGGPSSGYFELEDGTVYSYSKRGLFSESVLTKLENSKLECLVTDEGYYKIRIVKEIKQLSQEDQLREKQKEILKESISVLKQETKLAYQTMILPFVYDDLIEKKTINKVCKFEEKSSTEKPGTIICSSSGVISKYKPSIQIPKYFSITSNSNELLNDYLYYYLKSTQNGTTDFSGMDIPILSIETQQYIINKFTAIDNSISDIEHKIKLISV